MSETVAIQTTPEAVVKALSVKQLWGRFWYSVNHIDECDGSQRETAQRWADLCWGELIERGEARLTMFNQGEEMR